MSTKKVSFSKGSLDEKAAEDNEVEHVYEIESSMYAENVSPQLPKDDIDPGVYAENVSPQPVSNVDVNVYAQNVIPQMARNGSVLDQSLPPLPGQEQATYIPADDPLAPQGLNKRPDSTGSIYEEPISHAAVLQRSPSAPSMKKQPSAPPQNDDTYLNFTDAPAETKEKASNIGSKITMPARTVEIGLIALLLLFSLILLIQVSALGKNFSETNESAGQIQEETTSSSSTTTTTMAPQKGAHSLMADCGLGLADSRVENSQITASGQNSNSYNKDKVRLNSNDNSWIMRLANPPTGWIQFDFQTPVNISGIVTKGDFSAAYWVVTFKVLYGDNNDDLSYVEDHNGHKIFSGNVDNFTPRNTFFLQWITARYLRIEPVTWNTLPALRMEVLTPTNLLGEEVQDLPQGSVCVYKRAQVFIAK